ncbi:MAG: class I SAM-dependent methyltransferase [Bacteroidetes bacterium]|nr:class I SAM-dependent methyltransferase [Bacteroidota bacterium]MBS1649281.1 class I SAM-dependent methyltransferase [Bacteroidota bacterium]
MNETVTKYWNSKQLNPDIDGVAAMGDCGRVEIYFRNFFESKHFRKFISKKNINILEVGCGSGRWALNLYQHVGIYDGIDISRPSIEQAQHRVKLHSIGNCNFFCCSIQEYQPNKKYDIIYLSGVTQYIESDELINLLKIILTWLKPDGEIIDRSTISLEYETKKINRDNYYSIYRTLDEMINIFNEINFKMIYNNKSYRFLRIGRLKKTFNRPKIISLINALSPFSYKLMYYYTYIKDVLKPKVYREDICGKFSHDFMIFIKNDKK